MSLKKGYPSVWFSELPLCLLFFFKNNQLKIIPIPKRDWGGIFCSPLMAVFLDGCIRPRRRWKPFSVAASATI